MANATFIPTFDVTAEASRAGRFPGRRTVPVVDNRRLSDGIYRLTFRDSYIAGHAKPAQFVDVYSADPTRLMPRPFGVSEVEGDDVSLIFAVVGKGTEEFSHLAAGGTVDVMGPLGQGFDMKAPANYVLVAGGLGVPPLLYAAQKLALRDDATATAAFGYRDERFADDLVAKYAERVESITNAQGNVVDLLNSIEDSLIHGDLPPVILSCGPMPMMRAVASWALARGIPCQLSLEARMGCGYGTCYVCVVDTAAGRQKVCVAGPVFTPEQLGWDK